MVAGVALTLGLLVYLFARPPGSAYLLPAGWNLTGLLAPGFAAIGNQLPSFVHTLAFSLLTFLCLAPARHAALLGASAWLTINALFEFGQMPAAARWIAAHTPEWFASVPVLENIPDYFLAGTFDYLDLAAIGAGAVSAYLVAGVRPKENVPCTDTR